MENLKTVVAAFDEFSRAQQAVEALLLRKYDPTDISVVAGEAKRSPGADGDVAQEEEDDSSVGGIRRPGTVGASGMLGLVASLTALSIPGVGPILAAGPMLGLLTGATVGAAKEGVAGLVDALKQTGVTERDAHDYAHIICNGGALVLVRAAPHNADEIAALLRNLGNVDIERVRRRAVPGDYPEGGLGGDRSAAE